MDIGRIFARALEIAWRYRFLWLFGLIMGLTSGQFGGTSGGNSNIRVGSREFTLRATDLDLSAIGLILILILLLLLVWLVLTFYFRFVARGAMVTTVREVEAGRQPTLHSAWQQGQGYYTRLLGLGFLVNVPLILLTTAVIGITLLPLIGVAVSAAGGLDNREGPIFIVGIIGTALLFCGAILCVMLLWALIHPVYEFAVRAIVLENMQVMEGLSRGWERVRANLGNVAIIYLLLIGARIGWWIITAIIAIPLILIVVGIVMAAINLGPAALVLLITAVALPLWLVFGFLEGLFQVFESNVWTEAYLNILGSAPKTETAVVTPG